MHSTSVPLARANAARAQALATRSAALLDVGAGRATIWSVLRAARTNQPLMRIRLRQLLLAQEGWTPKRTNDVLRRTIRTAASTEAEREALVAEMKQLTVAWLLDQRSRGRRLLAFLDALADVPVWRGFPFTPAPQEGLEVARAWAGVS